MSFSLYGTSDLNQELDCISHYLKVNLAYRKKFFTRYFRLRGLVVGVGWLTEWVCGGGGVSTEWG